MLVRLEDPAGQLRTAKVGFSWTVFFFWVLCADMPWGRKVGRYNVCFGRADFVAGKSDILLHI